MLATVTVSLSNIRVEILNEDGDLMDCRNFPPSQRRAAYEWAENYPGVDWRDISTEGI
jgi:hypothetical protein